MRSVGLRSPCQGDIQLGNGKCQLFVLHTPESVDRDRADSPFPNLSVPLKRGEVAVTNHDPLTIGYLSTVLPFV